MKISILLVFLLISLSSFAEDVVDPVNEKVEPSKGIDVPEEVEVPAKAALLSKFILSLEYSTLSLDKGLGESSNEEQPYFQLAYKAWDQLWIEVAYGRSTLNDFPSAGLGTTLENYTFKIEYNYYARYSLMLRPYLGFQEIKAESAGSNNDPLVKQLNDDGIIFGVSLMREIRDDLFLRVDLGTDVLAAGFALLL